MDKISSTLTKEEREIIDRCKKKGVNVIFRISNEAKQYNKCLNELSDNGIDTQRLIDLNVDLDRPKVRQIIRAKENNIQLLDTVLEKHWTDIKKYIDGICGR